MKDEGPSGSGMMLVAAALVRRGGAVLLVRQQGPEDAQAHWSLPGGVVKPGEALRDALAREVREETGLALLDLGRLIYSTQTVEDTGGSAARVFETEACQGEIRCEDPDGLVLQAEYVPRAEAIERPAGLPWPNMRDPIIAYLRGAAEAGAVWIYRRAAGQVVLVARS